MFKEKIAVQKRKDELLYVIKDYIMYNVSVNKNALLNSLVDVGFTYRIFEDDREILIRENSKAVLCIGFIYINENDITLIYMCTFKSVFIRYSKLKHLYYRKFRCYNKEICQGGIKWN